MLKSDKEIEQFAAFIPYVQSLLDLPDELWDRPMREGKFSIRDTISHIMLWDKYYLEEAIQKAANGEPLTNRHLDFDQFNRDAVEYGRTIGKEQLVEMTMRYRRQIIDKLREIPLDDYGKKLKDGDGKTFTINGYLRGFIPHDVHHMKQIDQFIAENR